MTQPSERYGCFDRPPIQTFGNPQCQFTYTWAGQTDKRCDGCKHKETRTDGQNSKTDSTTGV